jgi:hypothetical protein
MAFVLIGILLVVVIVVAVVVQQRTAAARTRIESGLAELDVVRQDKADFYGQESMGPRQVRGVGMLALTADELVFFQLVKDADVRVPRSAITGVEVGREFLGKTHNRDLLLITWASGEEEPDQVAFHIDDMATWQADLAPAGG